MRLFLYILLSLFLIFKAISAENNFFNEGKKLFDEEKYDESKFLFERSIVYHPKDASSYLYLAKIYKIKENKAEEEKTINTTLLLDPKNEEATYLLMDMELERSNFSKVEELRKKFEKICSSLCDNLTSIDTRLKEFDKQNAS